MNRSKSTKHKERVVNSQNSSNVTFSVRATSPPSLSTLQNEPHGITFQQEVLNPQTTVFDISGQPVASQEYFNSPLKNIKISLLLLYYLHAISLFQSAMVAQTN